jgi:hypothetical protein
LKVVGAPAKNRREFPGLESADSIDLGRINPERLYEHE